MVIVLVRTDVFYIAICLIWKAIFHYRNIDVSTVKELARRWAPVVFASVQKKETHQALDDVLESIEEFKTLS